MLPHKVDIIPADYVVNIPSVEQDECNKNELDGLSCRCPSQSSSMYSNAADICRICHCEGTNEAPLITPCYCSGSLRYVHQGCLQQWIKSSDIRCCELCKFQFIMQTKIKPFNEWEYLEMSGLERKKLLCAMVFHIIAMTCVCWSLYVLIDRTLDEVQRGHLDWPFWTKLMVVGIGFMGGIVFMYIQCKAYFILCQRWKAYNRVIYVQNVPEKQRPKAVFQEINETDVPCTSLKSCSAANNDCGGGGGKEIVQSSGSCIDIKGVRNLHIFFNEENRVRLHKQELPMNQTAYSDNPTTLPPPVPSTGPDGCSSTCSKKGEKKNVTSENTSWHIEIGDSHRTTTSPPTTTSNDYGGAISPSENNGAEKELSPQLILQIKKAEIVIEFGGQNNSPDSSEFCEKNCESCRGEKCDDYINNLNFVDSTVENLPTSRLLKSYSDANLCDNKNHQLTDWSSNDNLLLKH